MLSVFPTGEGPKRKVDRPSKFESTKEWMDLKIEIERLQPGQSVSTGITDIRLEKMDFTTVRDRGHKVATGAYTIVRFIKKWLKETKRKKYKVRTRYIDDKNFIIVDGPPLPGQQKTNKRRPRKTTG